MYNSVDIIYIYCFVSNETWFARPEGKQKRSATVPSSFLQNVFGYNFQYGCGKMFQNWMVQDVANVEVKGTNEE